MAEKNATFYAQETISPELRAQFEKRYPPLDLERRDPIPAYLGYSVLNGRVRVSRPDNWVLRRASGDPGRRFIQYVSPREYIFSVYEWPDDGSTPWRDVLARYEQEAKDQKAEILERRIPVASFGSQGREYIVKRRVPAARTPFVNMSREILARGDRRIVLVQVVHQGDVVAQPEMDELRRVIETIEVDLPSSGASGRGHTGTREGGPASPSCCAPTRSPSTKRDRIGSVAFVASRVVRPRMPPRWLPSWNCGASSAASDSSTSASSTPPEKWLIVAASSACIGPPGASPSKRS